jgi:hypothetical protein
LADGRRVQVRIVIHSSREARIRSFGVGLLALATVAAAGFLLRYRRASASARSGRKRSEVEALYAAGL